MNRRELRPRRGRARNPVPQVLLGDWASDGGRYRFSPDGSYSIVSVQPYSVQGDQLQIGGESYTRRSGGPGLAGTWRTIPAASQWLDVVFGPYAYYGFQWDDGTAGGGYYLADGTAVAIIEQRARFECVGNGITFVTDSGVFQGTFAIAGDNLTIQFPGQTSNYTRIPF
jgi:hypothetical protein